jgi:hypothetical protein
MVTTPPHSTYPQVRLYVRDMRRIRADDLHFLLELQPKLVQYGSHCDAMEHCELQKWKHRTRKATEYARQPELKV